jgi:sensor histidine kinase YesM
VRIAVRRVGPTLHLEVRDTGEGLGASNGRPLREGIGLTNSRARLTTLYGDAASLRLGDAPGGGARVDVIMPFTTEADALPLAIGA